MHQYHNTDLNKVRSYIVAFVHSPNLFPPSNSTESPRVANHRQALFLVKYPFLSAGTKNMLGQVEDLSYIAGPGILNLCFRDIDGTCIRGNNLLFKCDEDNGELPNDFYCEPYKSKQTNECIFYCATGVAVLVLTLMLRAALRCAPV